MKLKKTILLATLAIGMIGVTSCKNDGEKDNNDKKEEVKTKFKVTYVTTYGISPDDVIDVTQIDNLPNLTNDNYNFLGWYYEATFETKANVGDTLTKDIILYAKWEAKPVAKYSVTFVTEKGSAPAQLTDLTALPEKLPTLEDVGDYSFKGWYLNSSYTLKAVSNMKITENTTLYAKWVKESMYDKLIKKGNVLYNSDFNNLSEGELIESKGEITSEIPGAWSEETSIYSYTNVKAEDLTGVYNIQALNGALKMNDGGSNGIQLCNSFGFITSGIVEGYVELTTSSIGDSWTFFQLYGNNQAKSKAELFGLRTDAGTLKYRLNGGNAIAPESVISTSVDTTFNVYFKVDLSTGNITVTINNQPFVTDLNIGVTEIYGYKLVSSDNNSRTLIIDNMVVRNEKLELEDYKILLSTRFSTEYNLIVQSLYTKNAAAIKELNELVNTNITNASTDLEAYNAYNDGLNTLNDYLSDSEITDLITSSVTEINNYLDKTKYTINVDAVDEILLEAETAYNNLTKKLEFDEMTTSFKARLDEIKDDETALSEKSTEALANLKAYVDEKLLTTGITEDITTKINSVYTNASTKIPAQISIADIESVLIDSKNQIDLYIKSLTQSLDDAKVEAKAALSAYASNVNNKYTGDLEEYQERINAIVTNGNEAIDSQTTSLDCYSKLDEYKALIDSEAVKIEVDIAKKSAINDLIENSNDLKIKLDYQTSINAIDEVLNNQIDLINACTSIDGVKTTYTGAEKALINKYNLLLEEELSKREIIKDTDNYEIVDSQDFTKNASDVKINVNDKFVNEKITVTAASNKCKIKANNYMTINGGATFTINAPEDNTVLKILYTSISNGRTFTLDGVTYTPYSDSTNKLLTFTLTKGTHTIVFDTNEHKIGNISLTYKTLTEVDTYLNKLTVETNTVSVGTAKENIIKSVTAELDYKGTYKNVTLDNTKYTYVLCKEVDGVLTKVDTVDAIGTYKLYVMYTGVTGETMTRYNSVIVPLTIE